MAKVQKCTGGCGKTQDVTIAQRGAPKGAFSFAPPWMCQECKAKAEKKRTEDLRLKDATEVGPKPPPDVSFTLVPRRTPGKLAAPPAPAPEETPEGAEAPEGGDDAGDVGDLGEDVVGGDEGEASAPPKSAEA